MKNRSNKRFKVYTQITLGHAVYVPGSQCLHAAGETGELVVLEHEAFETLLAVRMVTLQYLNRILLMTFRQTFFSST